MAGPSKNTREHSEVIGLIPAAGQATRIAPLPCSKELYPIGFHRVPGADGLRPKVAAHYLLEKMSSAGIRKAYFILRQGKWDIPGYFGSGDVIDMNLAYMITQATLGTPYTLDQAHRFVEHTKVAFGFPDIIFDEDNAFSNLLERQASTAADIVLGLFPVENPLSMDMVEVDRHGDVRSIIIKPDVTNLQYGWIIATWTPIFTQFLHEHLLKLQPYKEQGVPTNPVEKSELSMGHIFQAALRKGLRIQSVLFPESSYLDIGTPDNLIKAVHDRQFFKEIQH